MTEEVVEAAASEPAPSAARREAETISIYDAAINDEPRLPTGIDELDRVLGGGVVAGSVVLVGGEPGAGKSTLMLQMCGNVGAGADAIYVSGEESAGQIAMRAGRLGISNRDIRIAVETDVDSAINAASALKPAVVVVDSIQTMSCDGIASSPGSVTQVRECAARFMRMAKVEGIPVFIVSHVNKDGAIAGPKVMEHIVDTVLYFEGDKYLSYRILRSAKNRFGSTNEIGIFSMTPEGLVGVDNPSVAMLDGRGQGAPGSCVTCIIEGTRPLLSEIQSLAAKTAFGTPRRTASGFDYNRTNLLLAVLEKRAGFMLSGLDVYINAVGGLQMNEPAVDLAVAVSLVSAVTDRPVPSGMVAFGEIGLGGEVRSVSGAAERIAEARRLGFSACVMPQANLERLDGAGGIELVGISSVRQIGGVFVG
jgi:DNA repair protein RadA/Sms